MSKAFDTLSPALLMQKLQAYSVTNNSLAILKSYFANRKNRVRLSQVVSECRSVDRGCPQGSSLAPVLWNLYQNDVFYEDTTSQLIAYADDHQLYSSARNISDLSKCLEEDGTTTDEWYQSNHLTGNLSKYRVMFMSRGKKEEDQRMGLFINNHLVQQTQEIKLPGVVFDNGLQFSEHVSQICTRTSRKIGVLSCLKNLIPMTAKPAIYKAAILPHFNYCSLVWHFCRASDRKLERLDERGLRVVFKDWSASYDDQLGRTNMTSLFNNRLQDIAIFMHKIKHRMLPSTVVEIFNTDSTGYSLRSAL